MSSSRGLTIALVALLICFVVASSLLLYLSVRPVAPLADASDALSISGSPKVVRSTESLSADNDPTLTHIYSGGKRRSNSGSDSHPPEPTPSVDLSRGLVAYYGFNERGDAHTFNDASGNDYDGVCFTSGCPTPVSGGREGTLFFDGVNDVVRVPHEARLVSSRAVSVSAWVYMPSGVSNRSLYELVAKSDRSCPLAPCVNSSYSLSLRDPSMDGQFSAFFDVTPSPLSLGRVGTNSAPGSASLARWHHVVGVFDADSQVVRVYLNGVLTSVHNSSLSSGLYSFVGDLRIGDHFRGSMDEVRVYDRVLTGDEVSALGALSLAAPDYSELPVPSELDAGLGLHFGFDSLADGRFTDRSPFHTDAFCSVADGQCPTVVSGIRSTPVARFDGLNAIEGDIVTVADSLNVHSPQELSIATWFNLANISGDYATIVAKIDGDVDCREHDDCSNREYGLWVHSDGFITFHVTPNDLVNVSRVSCYTANGSISFGQWHHLVATANKHTQHMQLFLDGELVSSCHHPELFSNVRNSDGPVMIGRMLNTTWGGTVPFEGMMDDFRLYRRALNLSDVRALYALS